MQNSDNLALKNRRMFELSLQVSKIRQKEICWKRRAVASLNYDVKGDKSRLYRSELVRFLRILQFSADENALRICFSYCSSILIVLPIHVFTLLLREISL